MPLQFDRVAVKSLFSSGGSMLQLIHQFNAQPASYAHPSWFEALMPPDLVAVLLRTRRGVSRLSKILLQQHGLSEHSCYDFGLRNWRFALLPAEVIKKLTLYCGLAFQHRAIAAMVGKTMLAGIKKSIGEHAYTFAVKRAPLVIGQSRGIDLRWDGTSDFGLFARQYGAACFLSHFGACPKAIAGRLAFKFSRSMACVVVNRVSDNNDWALFKRILIHEIDPRWQTLFL